MQNNDKKDGLSIEGDNSFYKKYSTYERDIPGEPLGGGFYRLKITEAEKRQAKHDIKWVEDALLELLRNSRDARSTHIAVATSLHEGKLRELIVVDNGEGIPEEFHGIIFEPRVTSRALSVVEDEYGVHGRGMALYAISQRAIETSIVFSRPYCGTVIKASFDLDSIPERKNQTEKPRLVRGLEGYELRGPKNLIYTVADFYLKHPHLNIYLGSPAEILGLILKEPAFRPIREAFSLKGIDASSAIELSEKLNLGLSQRHVYRVVRNEVGYPLDIKKMFLKRGQRSRYSGVMRFSEDDWREIREGIERVVSNVAKGYSLKIREIRQVRSGETLKIQVMLEDYDELL
jgi:hypothetical protein